MADPENIDDDLFADLYDNDEELVPPPAAAPSVPEPEEPQPTVKAEQTEPAPAISNQQRAPSYENNDMSMNDYNAAMNNGGMGQGYGGQGYAGDDDMGYEGHENHDEPIGMKEDG